MSGSIKIRLAAFVLAIGLMVTLIAWTAHSSSQRIGDLQLRLTAVQLKSFQIADHFQETILELNNTVLRYGVTRDPDVWAHFATESTALDHWIDEQRPILPTEREKEILDQINAAYDDYMLAAAQIHQRSGTLFQSGTKLSEFADFEKQSQRILKLAFQLATAHNDSMNEFLGRSNRSLNYLRTLLLGSLFLLLLTGGGLAVVVYREMIAPLQVRLVENQQVLERQEKLASLGMLAAGIAHEIRNPLTALKAWLFIQNKNLSAGSVEYEDAKIISQEISRLESLARDFLLFAKPSEPAFETIAADQPMREVQTLLAPQLNQQNIHLSLNWSTSVRIRIDPQQIKQVLINLIQNAADSIGNDGEIVLRVRTENKRFSERASEVVILEIADTGKGIPPEVEKRLFDPFFTTKETGTGLGLSIAARIVEKHGGALQYQTQLNRGTTFGIVLPRA